MIIILLVLSTLFSGCFKESEPKGENSNLSDNQPPVGIISAPKEAYFGETIEVSALKSYDTDGEIVSYTWYFGDDDERAEGLIVKYTYKFENNFIIDYPLIYFIHLIVRDDNDSTTATSHQIKIYPSEFKFYLNSQELVTGNPSSHKDKIRGSGLLKLRSPKVLTYNLENPITIEKCTWNATIYLKKPRFPIANKLSILFYDRDGKEITRKDEKLGLNFLWKEKTVKLRGTFDKDEEFKTVKIGVYGFSLRQEISILYGGEKASHICFDFTT
jgi:hypothetical protein